jgi:NifU-like protein involved in Fe-S cluster formation
MFSTKAKGVRYLEMAEGYVTKIALDEDDEVCGYQFVRLGVMMEQIKKGVDANEALKKATATYGRFTAEQGACKLTLNVKEGIIEEALVETIGCSGMTHSAAMAAEILPGKTLLEALNTDLVCDAINTAMRELFLQIVYGRTQSAFSEGGLVIGAGLEDLGKGLRSQVGTMFSTKAKGVRYLEMAEGYVTKIALDQDDEVCGYQFVRLGVMMEQIKKGVDANEALKKATATYGRFTEEQGAVKFIDPRID